MSHHNDDGTGQEHQDDLGVEQAGAGTESKGPQAEPATEQGRGQNEHLRDDAPQQDQVLDRDQISQNNDPSLKR